MLFFCFFFIINFQDFVANLSLLIRGSEEERLLWTFKLYDIKGDGVISRWPTWFQKIIWTFRIWYLDLQTLQQIFIVYQRGDGGCGHVHLWPDGQHRGSLPVKLPSQAKNRWSFPGLLFALAEDLKSMTTWQLEIDKSINCHSFLKTVFSAGYGQEWWRRGVFFFLWNHQNNTRAKTSNIFKM